MKAAVICISRADGAEGQEIGAIVAERLGYRLEGDSIIVDAANAEGLIPEAVSYAEDATSGRVLEVDFGRTAPAETVRELIRTQIAKAADGGDVVIVEHAASYALAGRDGVLRVLVTASTETRLSRIAAAEQFDEKQAAKRLSESDEGRVDYLERFYGIKGELPTDYDIVINTDRLTAHEAADAIIALAT